jgi:LysM repeat protein
MKILKIFGAVAGLHIAALLVIFANPGCSSTAQPPASAETAAAVAAPSVAATPQTSSSPRQSSAASSSAGITFNPDAPAIAAPSSGGSSGVRLTPTRPGSVSTATVVSEPVTDVTPATTYVVKSGDNLWNVAKKHHVTVAELAAANNLRSDAKLQPKQKLLIPGKAASPTVAAAANPASAPPRTPETAVVPRPTNKELKHVVKSGETLGAIARMYGVKAGDIAAANHIADPAKINIGTELTIPGWETPAAGKPGKSTQKSSAPTTKKSSEKSTPSPANVDTASSLPVSPAQPPPVPVISIDDSPLKPAPKP